MNTSPDFRPALAAAVLLALLAGAYGAAVQFAPLPARARLQVETQLTTDTTAWGATGREAPPAPVPAAPKLPAAAHLAPLPPPYQPVLPTAAQLGHRRYVGTVDGRPVVADITLWLEPSADVGHQLYPELTAYYYYRATGVSGTLGQASRFRPDEWLETWESKLIGHYYERISVLCADQPPGGPLLTGWCTPPGQCRAVPVRLRESYADGVRYEILRQENWVPASSEDKPDVSSVSRSYIHLLGRDTLRPALARLQCPPPAARRRIGQALLKQIGEFDHDEESFDITLNEAGLLAFTAFRNKESGPRYYIQSRRQGLYDLRAGRALRLADQLRPGSRQQLQRLLMRRALADSRALTDTAFARHRDHWRHGKLLALPNEGFDISPTGWTACYGELDQENSYGYGLDISWADVAPLLRPASPLSRLLRLRGLRP